MTGWNEYDAARHCLEAPSVWRQVGQHVHGDWFDWPEIDEISRRMSSGERILLDAAKTFWNTRNDANVLGRSLSTLDGENTQRLVEAILIYTRINAASIPATVAA